MKRIFLQLFIYIKIFSYISTIFIIPFQTYNPFLTNNETLLELIKNVSDKSIVDTLSRNLIYTELKVGENLQTVPTFIEMMTKNIIITDISIKNNNGHPPIKNSNFSFCKNYLLKSIFKSKYYNSKTSESYSFVENCYDFIMDFVPVKNSCGNESIYMMMKKNINDSSSTRGIKFYITFKKSDYHDDRPAIIGLNYYSKLISELKERDEINGYDFSFKYTNIQEDRGELIIGDLPSIYDSNNYEEKNMKSAKIIKDSSIKWCLNFDVIISSNIQNKNDKNEYYLQIDEIAYFYIEEFFITGSNKYFNKIEEIFFNKYIDKKICRKGLHQKAYYEDFYYHIICYIEDVNERNKFFEEFPNVKLYQKEMNYNFTLTSKDLFTIIPDGKRILFNIDFTFNSNKWILGKPFFKKYQLNFNSDSNLISYFSTAKDLESNIEINSNRGKGWKIVLTITLVILAFTIGIIIGRALCNKYNRKIRANELEDNYSYVVNEKIKDNNMTDPNDLNVDYKSKYYNLN